jgi:hypothetical protein
MLNAASLKALANRLGIDFWSRVFSISQLHTRRGDGPLF